MAQVFGALITTLETWMEFQDPGFCLLHPGMLQAFQSYLAGGRFLRLDVCFLFLCVLNNDISISSSSSSSSNAYLGSPNFQVKIVVLMFVRDIPRKDSFYNCGYFWGLWGKITQAPSVPKLVQPVKAITAFW